MGMIYLLFLNDIKLALLVDETAANYSLVKIFEQGGIWSLEDLNLFRQIAYLMVFESDWFILFSIFNSYSSHLLE